MLNAIGSATAYIGFVIGALIASWESWKPWVFTASAGLFLYVAWIDMVTACPDPLMRLERGEMCAKPNYSFFYAP